MANTSAKGAPSSPSDDKGSVAADPSSPELAAGAPVGAERPLGRTRTDDNVNKPSTVFPGEAPADTLDPSERVSTVPHQPDEEALRAGTVNAVLVNPALPTAREVAQNLRESRGARSGEQERVETYEATRPNGQKVTVTHNLDTGETSAS